MNSIKIALNTLNSSNYKESIQLILAECSHKTQVRFALYCNVDLDKYYDVKKDSKVYEARQKCIELINKWLIDDKSVSKEELKKIADAAYYAYHAASNANNVAYNATYAAYYATYYAAYYAVNAAYNATYAAHYAATTASNAAHDESARQSKYKELYEHLISLILPKNYDKKMVEILYMSSK